MSMMNTLAKVAVGIAVAKGASAMMGSRNAGASGGGGLGGMLGGLMGGGQQQNTGRGNMAQSGGGLFGQVAQQMGQSGGMGGGAGGLAGMLGGLMGGGQGQQGGAGQMGGLGGLAGMLAGATGGMAAGGAASGGLGGLLESLGGGGAVQGAHANAAQMPAAGGFGDMFNNALAGNPVKPEPSQEEIAELMLRAMINAQKADGTVDDSEKAKLMDKLGEVDAQEAAFVQQEFSQELDMDAFVASIPKGMEGQVYLMSLMAIDLDTQAEAQYLDDLGKRLGISNEMANNIHDELGAPKLYG